MKICFVSTRLRANKLSEMVLSVLHYVTRSWDSEISWASFEIDLEKSCEIFAVIFTDGG